MTDNEAAPAWATELIATCRELTEAVCKLTEALERPGEGSKPRIKRQYLEALVLDRMEPGYTYSAYQLHQRLVEDGSMLSERQVSNTLSHARAKGSVERVRRNLYRLVDAAAMPQLALADATGDAS